MFHFVGTKAAPAPEVDVEPEPSVNIYLHVAKPSLSPWIPVWHRTDLAEAPFGNPPVTDARIYTKVFIIKYKRVSLAGNF